MGAAYYPAPSHFGGGFITDIEAQALELFYHALVSGVAFGSHVFQSGLKDSSAYRIAGNPEAEEMRLAPCGLRAYLTATNENNAPFTGGGFRVIKAIKRVVVGKGHGIEARVCRFGNEGGGAVSAVGGGTVCVEVDTRNFHTSKIVCLYGLSMALSKGIDERR